MKSASAASACCAVTGQAKASSVPKWSGKRASTSAMTSRVMASGGKRCGAGGTRPGSSRLRFSAS